MNPDDYIILLPHSFPIQMIDHVTYLSDTESKTKSIIKKENPFLEENNRISEMAYIELMAQTTAIFLIYHRCGKKEYTIEEFKKLKEEGKSLGFLVTIKNLENYSTIQIGDEVEVTARLDTHLDDYYIFIVEVLLKAKVISKGELTIYAEQSLV